MNLIQHMHHDACIIWFQIFGIWVSLIWLMCRCLSTGYLFCNSRLFFYSGHPFPKTWLITWCVFQINHCSTGRVGYWIQARLGCAWPALSGDTPTHGGSKVPCSFLPLDTLLRSHWRPVQGCFMTRGLGHFACKRLVIRRPGVTA